MLAAHQDAFGQLMIAAHEGRPAFEIIERDDGRVDAADASSYLSLPRRPDMRSRELLDAARGRVLDIGCGAGRYAIALQRRDHEVLGIDQSPGALQVARAQGLKHSERIAVTAIGKQLGQFDTLLMGGNNFGLLENPKRGRWLLSRFAAVTPDDGQILATSLDIYQTEDPHHRAYLERNRKRGRMPGQLRLRVLWQQYRSPWFDYLMVSPDEMRALLEGTPWRMQKVIETGGPTYAAIITKG